MSINWSPSPVEEIVQNVRTLLVTAVGSVPFARALGTPQDLVDAPVSLAGAQMQAAVINAVRTYEPRVAVRELQVQLATDADGKLVATATLGAP